MKASKPLKALSSLKAKKSLKAHGKLKSIKSLSTNTKGMKSRGTLSRSQTGGTRKRLRPEQKTAAKLIPLADQAFSKYVRLRDSELVNGRWVGVCITCPRKMVVYEDGRWSAGAQCGHLIGRGTFSLRWDEENSNLQCAHCNAWLDKDEMIERYRGAVDDKYGTGTYAKLKARSRLPDALKRPTKPELLEIIKDSNAQVDFYLASED